MSQNNTDFSNDMSGVELLDDYLTPLQENINTSNSGVQRPSYAVAGTKWLDTSVTPWLWKMYDGTDDVTLGTVNPSTHLFTPKTPLTTAGDILVQGTDGNLNKLAAGVAGTVLTANGAGALPTYQVNPIGVLTYSSSYTYKKKDIVVSTNEDDETALYKSLIDNNIGNNLTDYTKWEKLALGGGGGMPIGTIGYTLRTDVPENCAWCDGAEYTQEMFPDIYQMLVDGKINSTDYTTFAESVSTNGSCGFFALDTGTQKFKVPLLTNVYIKAGQAPSMFGAESLPNITGSLTNGGVGFKPSQVSSNGCIFVGSALSGSISTASATSRNVSIDASRSSSTYQNGAKVNPDHVVYRAYVVLYSSAAEASEAQAAEFITALGGKANVGLDNITAEAKDLIAGLCLASEEYIDYSPVYNKDGKEVAPANGYFVHILRITSGSAVINLESGGLISYVPCYVGSSIAVFLPVKKGKEVNYFAGGASGAPHDVHTLRFYYLEGSKK